MMLRSRNANVQQAPAGKTGDGPAKRQSKHTETAGEPKAKRAALCELSNAISNVLIDSSKKQIQQKPVAKRGPSRRTNSATENLEAIPEDAKSSDDSVMIVAEVRPQNDSFDPCPSFDYDAENKDDPFNVPQFACDIFRYYRSREVQFAVGDYLPRHANLSREMRAVLADWMVEVQESFELNHETLYLAVKLVDLYLGKTEGVKRDDLQLIASAAIFIAAKFDERQPPLIDDFLFICEDTFSREAMMEMERKMLSVVGFDLGCPLSYRYLRRYAKVTHADMALLTLSRYVMETSLMFYEFVPVSESRMAAAAFLLALRMKNGIDAEWTPVLHKYSGWAPNEVEPLMWELNHMLHRRPAVFEKLQTVWSKYSHEVFFESAAVPLLTDRKTPTDPVGPPTF